MSAANLSNVDGGETEASAKTRFVMKVADSTEEFMDAFNLACSTDFKTQIAGIVHPDSIRAALAKVDVDQVLGRDAAYSTFKTAYGFKTWLLAPEEGVRGLLREAIQLYNSPLKQELDDMHLALVDAAKSAMKKSRRRKVKCAAGGGIVAGSLEASLRELLLDQAVRTVGIWRDQTWEQLSRNLHAESEFPSPERFAVLKARLNELLGAAAAHRSAQMAAEHKRQLAASLGLSLDALPLLAAGPHSAPKIPAAVAAVATAVQDDIPSWSEFYMGWLEKRSRRGLWQRRWFALSVRQQRMWYFGHPEEQPARGTVDLKGAMLLAEEEGESKLAFRVVLPTAFAAAVDGSSAAEKHHQDTMAAFTGSKTKTHAIAVSLRAGSVGSREEWLDMLGKAISGVPPTPQQALPQAQAPPLPVLQNPLANEDETSSGVERKISTKVFADSRAASSLAKPAEEHKTKKSEMTTNKGKKAEAVQGKESKKGVAAAPSSSASASVSEEDEFHELDKGEIDEEVDEEARVEAELCLFEEIALQAAEDEPTTEEWNMLECISKAVKEYVEEAQVALTEQASKVIADGMLPMNRADELHAALLKVLNGTEGMAR